MQNSLHRYLAVMFAPQNSIFRLMKASPFLEYEGIVTQPILLLFFVTIIGFIPPLINLSLTQEDPERCMELAEGFLVYSLGLLIMLWILYMLYNRKITRNQFIWCSEVYPYMKLPAPTMSMRRLELALYCYRFEDLDESIRERYNPFKYD